MSRIATIAEAVDLINDTAEEGSELGVHLVFSGWYTAVLLGDHNLWDNEDNRAPCDRCESDEPGAHECPDETADGLAEVLRGRLLKHAEDVLALAGWKPTPPGGRP